MTEAPIVTEIEASGLATVTLNRPEVHNAFDDDLIVRLALEFGALEDDDGVRAVILKAQGKSFSAGADLNWMARTADYTPAENMADAEALAAMMKTIDTLSKPTIALVQGAAIGGGAGLVAACDIAIASERAVFSFSEVKLGLIPAVISPYVVAAIGPRQARRYFLTAERFGAAEAQRLGLVHLVVAEDELESTARELVGALLENGPRALAAAKDLIAAVKDRPIDDAVLKEVAGRIAVIRVTDEGQEGIAAFLEKRKPAWVKE